MKQLDAAYFDQWYTDIIQSPIRDTIVQRELGLPPQVESSGMVSRNALTDVLSALDLSDGQVLVDLACGRGGYTLAIARSTGARIVGIDFSAVAVKQATRRASEFGLAGRADFKVADFSHTGLPDRIADALLCVDSIQFADSIAVTLQEWRRLLIPGGRLVITGWEVVDPTDERLPQALRRVDLAAQLAAAGLERVKVVEMPAWRDTEQSLARAALTLDAGDDAALRSLQEEGRGVLTLLDHLRRVLATACAPISD
jgi:SAM-dependent methyltransferase